MADPFSALGFTQAKPQGKDADPFSSLGFSEQKAETPQSQPPSMSKFESALTGFNTGAGNLAHGALQTITESGLLGERVKQGSKRYAQGRQAEYQTAHDANPNTAAIGNLAGGLVASTPLMAIPGLGQGALARGVTQGAIQGGLMGGSEYVPEGGSRALNAGLGATLGAAAYPIVKGITYPFGMMFGTKNTRNKVGNKILDSLEKNSKKGSALTPEETAENLAANFTDKEGKSLPIDIGTVANNPTMKKAYGALKYAPFSGASKNMNIVKAGQADKAIKDAEGNIIEQGKKGALVEQEINNQIEATQIQKAQELATLKSQGEMDKGKVMAEINKRIASPEAGKLKSQIDSMIKEQNKYSKAIDQAPSYLNKLAQHIPDRSNVTGTLKNNVRDLYSENKKVAAENYRPINESNVRLDVVDPESSFKNYRSSATELLARRENLKNLFASDSDLGAKLNSELNKAESMLKGDKEYGVTAKEAVQRIQTIGKLAATAKSQGNRYEGMLLDDLQNGLAEDVHGILNKTGHANLATALLKANEHYKTNIVPFWQHPEIRKAATDKAYIPSQDKLSKALHDPNNQSILGQLSPGSKNLSLYQLMTKGKGTSKGLSNLGAEDIAANYASLPVDTKRAISSYNAEADKYFEGLSTAIKIKGQLMGAQEYIRQNLNNLQSMTSKEISAFQKNLEKIKSGEASSGEKIKQSEAASIEKLKSSLDKLKEKNQKVTSAAEKKLQEAKNQKFGNSKEGGAISNAMENAIKATAVGGGLAGGVLNPMTLGLSIPAGLTARSMSKILSNPDLIKAYINKSKLPVKKSKNINRHIASGLIGSANQENNNR